MDRFYIVHSLSVSEDESIPYWADMFSQCNKHLFLHKTEKMIGGS